MENKQEKNINIKELRNKWAEDHCTVHVKKDIHMRTAQDEKHDKQFKANCHFFDNEYAKLSAKERSLVKAAIIATMNQLFMDVEPMVYDSNTHDIDPDKKDSLEIIDEQMAWHLHPGR